MRDKHQASLSQAEVEAFYVRGEKPQGVLHILRALGEHFLLEAADLYRLRIILARKPEALPETYELI